MRGTILAAALALAVPAAAQAWEYRDTQPATNEAPIWAYPTKYNYCPDGLSPVVVGGVICCGTPNRTGYRSHRVIRKKQAKRPVVAHRPQEFIVYEKGQ